MLTPYKTKTDSSVQINEQPKAALFVSTNTAQDRARRAIANSQVPFKTWAYRLGLTDRIVQMWVTKEREIPCVRVEEILDLASELLIEQREAIDAEINVLLRFAYGRNK